MITVPYEVKKALRDGMLRKNYRFVVLNDDGTEDFTIDNDTLVSESVNIDERMCSGDTLKFGLCEGSSLEFQYFFINKGAYSVTTIYMLNELVTYNSKTWRSKADNNTGHTPVEGTYWTEFPTANIYGRRVQVFVDVQCFDDDDTSYHTIGELVANGAAFTVTETCNYQFTIPANVSGLVVRYDANGIEKAQQSRPARQEPWLIVMPANVGDYFLLTSTYSYSAPIGIEASHYYYAIPMGFFDVKKCSRQASTGIIKVTAYNKLMSDYLDAKANQEIVDIVSQGEEGNTTVSFYWILDKLLKDYSIEKYDTGVFYDDIPEQTLDSDSGLEYWVQGHAGQVYEMCFPLYEGGSLNFKYLHICGFMFNLGGFQGDQAYYDKFLFNGEIGKNITEHVYKTGTYSLDDNKVRDTDSAQFMTLRDFLLNGGWATFHATADVYYTMDTQKRYVGGLIEKDENYIINLVSDYTTDIHYISITSNLKICLPYYSVVTNSTTNVSSMTDYKTYFRPLHHTFNWIYKEFELNIPESAMQRITLEQAEGFGDVTLRDLQTAVYESVCQFGQLSRTTDLFSGVDLNYGGLYPADTLYPANDLYPGGAVMSANKAMYSQLWADEGNIHKWRNLIITYKGLNEDQQEEDFTLERQVNADGTDDYNMSDNWLFKNLIWTEEQIDDYADAMIAKMQNHEWFPFEMWLPGLPYLETGDQIEIPLNGEVYTSYVLQRQLKGIHNLQDTYINGTLDIF